MKRASCVLCSFSSAFQALCECALQTPYDSLKLGMLSVLSTLSGTIAVKHYFSIASGKEKIYGWCASPFIHVDVSGGFLYEALASGKVSVSCFCYMVVISLKIISQLLPPVIKTCILDLYSRILFFYICSFLNHMWVQQYFFEDA